MGAVPRGAGSAAQTDDPDDRVLPTMKE